LGILREVISDNDRRPYAKLPPLPDDLRLGVLAKWAHAVPRSVERVLGGFSVQHQNVAVRCLSNHIAYTSPAFSAAESVHASAKEELEAVRDCVLEDLPWLSFDPLR
jgi:hypothetical protein